MAFNRQKDSIIFVKFLSAVSDKNNHDFIFNTKEPVTWLRSTFH